VIEDAAEAHGAEVDGRKVGGIGDLSTFSFYANKIITTGEGGMITTNDDALADRLRLLRNLAFQTPRFYHEHAGFNFRMTGMQAALGRSQLRRVDAFVEEKRRIAETYNRLLADVPGVQTPVNLDWARNVYWMYSVVIGEDFPLSRDDLMTGLADRGIQTRTFFCPVSRQPFLHAMPGSRKVDTPVADRLWERGMYLPCSVSLDDAAIESIVGEICDLAGVRA
jgi:perosamine synthetase